MLIRIKIEVNFFVEIEGRSWSTYDEHRGILTAILVRLLQFGLTEVDASLSAYDHNATHKGHILDPR